MTVAQQSHSWVVPTAKTSVPELPHTALRAARPWPTNTSVHSRSVLLAALTVSGAAPVAESLLAVIVVEPGLRPLATPCSSIVATPALELVQVTAAPESSYPRTSRTT